MKRACLLLALLLAPPLLAQQVHQPRLHTLDNGLRVLTVEDHSMPLVSSVWSAHVGDSAEPPDFAGNSHYLEHLLLFRGTEKYPKNQIGEWASSRGGYFNGNTWYDHTAFVLMCAPEDLDGALDRHAQMMFHGAFSGQDFETEKSAVFEELRARLDSPYGYVWQAAPYHMYPQETFYSRSTIGTIDTVQAATVARVREYYKKYYVPNNMTLAVAGDFNTEELLGKLRQTLGRYPASNVPDSIYSPLAMKPGITLVTEERNLGKAYFLLASEGPQASSPEYFPFVLLVEYLSGGNTSLLKNDLVIERKLLDEISMSDWPRRYPYGWQGIDGETEPGKLVDAVARLWTVLAEVGHNGVPTNDMEFARQRLLKRHRQVLDDQYELAQSLVVADAHGDYRLFAEYESRLNKVSAADLQAVAQKYFKPEHFFLMSLFPAGETPAGYEATIRANAAAMPAAQSSVNGSTLESGLTLLYEGKPGSPLESYSVAIRAGERYGERAGLAGAVATMMARETARYSRTELQNYLDENGFTLSASTDSDAAYIELQAPAGSSAAAMALLVEVLSQPAFRSDEWTVARQETIAALQSSLDEPRSVAADLFTSTLYAGTPYGRSVADQLEALPTIDARDLKGFWSRHYKARSIAVSYHGDASAERLRQGLAPLAALKGKVPNAVPVNIAAIEGVIHKPQAMPGMTQDNIYVGWLAPPVVSNDWVLWELAVKAIGGDLAGRLWKLRQQEGLAYSVWMASSDRAEQPMSYIYMATAGDKRNAALAAIRREIAAAQSGLGQQELDRVKVSYLANLNRLDRTAARRAHRHAAWWVRGLPSDYRDRLTSMVQAATLTDVNRVIAAVLNPDSYVFVEAGALGK